MVVSPTCMSLKLKEQNLILLELGYNLMGPSGSIFNHVYSNTLQIGAKGADHMADMLKYNNMIATLDLRANGLRDNYQIMQGAICLACNLKVVMKLSCHSI